MSETVSKIDQAAERAYAEAAAKTAGAKKADPAPVAAKAADVPGSTTSETKAAPAKKVAAKKASPKKAAAKKAPAKTKTSKTPATKKVAAKKTTKRATAPKAAAKRVTKKDTKTMATKKTTEKKTETKFKAAAADMQDRAKAVYAKAGDFAGEMGEFTKGNVEAVVESGKILASGMQTMARESVEDAKGVFQQTTEDLRLFAAVKSPTELFKLQGEIARRNFDAAVKYGSKRTEANIKLANEAFAPIQNRISVAGEKLRKAA